MHIEKIARFYTILSFVSRTIADLVSFHKFLRHYFFIEHLNNSLIRYTSVINKLRMVTLMRRRFFIQNLVFFQNISQCTTVLKGLIFSNLTDLVAAIMKKALF